MEGILDFIMTIANVGFAIGVGGFLVYKFTELFNETTKQLDSMSKTMEKQSVLIDKMYDKIMDEEVK